MKRVYVAGHNGMVGSAICRYLSNENIDLITASSSDLNLINQPQVESFLNDNKIDEIYLAAAKVGGIHANNAYPAEFIYENLMIQANIIHTAHKSDIQKLLFLGSSCIYPKISEQPIPEESLLSGKLELTNEPYAIAKIAGIKLCESYNRQYSRDYRSVMPTNLYGPQDNFHSENSHVIPGLISRFHEAKKMNKKEIFVWGSGKPMREFLHVDDMASASIHIMNLKELQYKKNLNPMLSHINIGSGKDISIHDLANLICDVVGYEGRISWDETKPDGTLKKLLDVSKLQKSGWSSKINLIDGIKETYKWYVENIESLRN